MEVPYSEQSSFSEFRIFIKFVRMKEVSQIIPMVNRGNFQAIEDMFLKWIEVRKKEASPRASITGLTTLTSPWPVR